MTVRREGKGPMMVTDPSSISYSLSRRFIRLLDTVLSSQYIRQKKSQLSLCIIRVAVTFTALDTRTASGSE